MVQPKQIRICNYAYIKNCVTKETYQMKRNRLKYYNVIKTLLQSIEVCWHIVIYHFCWNSSERNVQQWHYVFEMNIFIFTCKIIWSYDLFPQKLLAFLFAPLETRYLNISVLPFLEGFKLKLNEGKFSDQNFSLQ